MFENWESGQNNILSDKLCAVWPHNHKYWGTGKRLLKNIFQYLQWLVLNIEIFSFFLI